MDQPSFNSIISIDLFSFKKIWHCVDIIMVHDATTLLKVLEMLVYEEELAETPFDVVISQWSCNE